MAQVLSPPISVMQGYYKNVGNFLNFNQAPPSYGSGRSARQVLCGDASRLCLDHFAKHLSSVLGLTELCHEVRNPGPKKPQIIRNENHHLALFVKIISAKLMGRNVTKI